jgi:hypothetical protein
MIIDYGTISFTGYNKGFAQPDIQKSGQKHLPDNQSYHRFTSGERTLPDGDNFS